MTTVFENVTDKTHERNQPSFLYLLVLLCRQPALAPCSSIAAPDKALVSLVTVPSIFRNYRVIPSPRDLVCASHYPALLSFPGPVLFDQLLRPRPDSLVLIFEGQDQRIGFRGRGLSPGLKTF